MTRRIFTLAICAVDGCDRAVRRRGYCEKHAHRDAKYGSPIGGRTFQGEPRRYLADVVLKHASADECLIWPYARNSAGYGHLSVDGKNQLVHRIACEAENGPPPFADAQASHSCGNGHLGCCNPKHQRWDTPAGNLADKARHGTLKNGVEHHLAKLTEDDVRAIRASDESQSVLASRYGVEQTNISAIKRRKSWNHIT
jgi:hypothetical protein